MTIIVTREGDGFSATVVEKPDAVAGKGKNLTEAVGKLIENNQQFFNLTIEFIPRLG